MAFTYVSPIKHDSILPSFTTKPCLPSKLPNSSHPKLFNNHVSPKNSGRIHAAITNVATDLSYKDAKPKSQGEKLHMGLVEELMPKHIAFIMDGNRRWAEEKGWSPMTGHSAMRKTLQSLLLQCRKLKIKAVSIYAFSTENWTRPTVSILILFFL